MIRGIFRSGVVQPLAPLPAGWKDGQEVKIDELDDVSADGTQDSEAWAEEMRQLTATLNDPEEWRAIETGLAEADRQSKAMLRREMGLP
jgi:hypothetical protein